MDTIRTKEHLAQLQSLPLEAKIILTKQRIKEWYEHFNGDVCVSFSGGKDSTVLAHIVHEMYPEVPLVFANTGLEFPELQMFARKIGAEFVRPSMSFRNVITEYGYPVISKQVSAKIWYARRINIGDDKRINYTVQELNMPCNYTSSTAYDRYMLTEMRSDRDKELIHDSVYIRSGRKFNDCKKWGKVAHEAPFLIGSECCHVMKKSPLRKYQKETGRYPIIGTQAEESFARQEAWLQTGCNAFNATEKKSMPLSFWTTQDVLKYIKENEIEIAPVYGDVVYEHDEMQYTETLCDIGECNLKCTGYDRTGCIFCGYGFHLEKGETRFQRLAKTHPKQYDYCIGGGEWADNPYYEKDAPEYDGFWKNWNPKKIWIPNEKGLGMGFVFDTINELYGKQIYRYE